MTGYIVCGWYTPDYAHWLEKLIPSLEAVGARHDFVEVPPLSDCWETNTLRKAAEIKRAMGRHPTKTIIFLDVDCTVLKPLSPLVMIKGDLGLYLRTKYRKDGSTKAGWRSGTIVIRPTAKAYDLVSAWIAEGERACRYSVDQDSLAVALGRVPGLSITTLGVEWCATVGDECSDPAIYHDSASLHTKTPRLVRTWHRLIGRRLAA